MENILIAYTVKDTSLLLTVEDAIDSLTAGELLAIGNDNIILGSTTLAAGLVGVKEVMFVVGLGNGKTKNSVSIPRRNITSYNQQVSTTPQVKQIRVGGTTAPLALVIPSTGEANILLKNLSYNHGIATQRISYSTMKKATETPEQFVDRVVLEINATMALQSTPFATASKVIASGNIGIDFTASSEHIDLFVGRDGIFATSAYSVIQEAKVGIGAGVDVIAMEKDMQRHHGDSGYQTNGDLWYKEPLQAKADTRYDLTTIYWNGIADTPTSSMLVAKNVLQFAADYSVTDDTVLEFIALLVDGQDKAIIEVDTDAISE